jgi:hypothetical protein
MKKPTPIAPKQLRLATSTVRALSTTQLFAVAAGARAVTSNCNSGCPNC